MPRVTGGSDSGRLELIRLLGRRHPARRVLEVGPDKPLELLQFPGLVALDRVAPVKRSAKRARVVRMQFPSGALERDQRDEEPGPDDEGGDCDGSGNGRTVGEDQRRDQEHRRGQ